VRHLSVCHLDTRFTDYTGTNSGARGKVWGSDDVNVEGWKALKRLPGHESGPFL